MPSIFEEVAQGVYTVHDDTGRWGGHPSNSITHQVHPDYQAKKVLDLSGVPPEVWEQVREVRLAVQLMVHDHSPVSNPPANGLDEAFEIVVNGTVHRYPMACGAPVYVSGTYTIDWFDFVLPKEEFTLGPNEVILRKAPGDKYDDYLYLGIDNAQKRGNSYVTFNGRDWTQDRLTVPGGNGEYVVRLYLITGELSLRATWRPGQEPEQEDPRGLILYAGAKGVTPGPDGLRLEAGQAARVEWDPARVNPAQAVTAALEGSGQVRVAWLDASDKPGEPTLLALPGKASLPAPRSVKPSGLRVEACDGSAVLSAVTITAGLSYYPQDEPIDMCPRMAPPAGGRADRTPTCQIGPEAVILANAGLRCAFEVGGRLRLRSLYNQYTASEMVRDANQVALFLVEVAGKRYAGSREFVCREVKPSGANGFAAHLTLAEPALHATLSCAIEEEGLRMGLEMTNAGDRALDFKLAFPHLAGLRVSGDPGGDYYFFPWGGGIIADRPAFIRRGYGDHEALYQVMDLFSPGRGGGLYVRIDDAEGWHKTLALRKWLPGKRDLDVQHVGVQTAEEYKWQDTLERVEGIGVACEYLRRTRGPQGSFAPAPAVLAAHAGDWHVAMRAYADWAHRVWRFRPCPSRLRHVHSMICPGWGQDILYRDGKYRTDFIQPNTECVELMSWWDWSPLGPWGIPIDKVREVLGEATYRMWEPYFVKDPVTGQMMWNDQPGDYLGYNERFGGLPAFQQAVRTYQRMGVLVTLYTDPFRLDDNCPTGKAHGKEWGVIGPDGEYTKAYDVWNPCHDNPAVRQWVAETMGRVMRETGADGIRLDEYGHRGWACFSTLHPHTFSERGVSQWQKAVAETCRMVHEAMDQVRPDLVLTTEHPGYDYLMQFLEGCITYDLTVQACDLRPLECNLQRFYFPECKPYELDHRGVDPASKKMFWNAVESFGRYYPPAMHTLLKENEDVYQSGDCEPLVPTLVPRVYANRFSGAGKTIYHLYNASGHTVDGPLLAVPTDPDHHWFDLLAGRECQVVAHGEGQALALHLPRGDIACLASFPRRLTVAVVHNTLQVTVSAPPAGCRVVLCDTEGGELLSQDAEGGAVSLDLSRLPEKAKMGWVKLVAGGEMLAAAEVPERGSLR